MESELNHRTLLEWCQGELRDVEEYSKKSITQYQKGITDGVGAVLNSLIYHFDLEGK